jgi:uncharacterized protein YjbI with pentapeptide repeats
LATFIVASAIPILVALVTLSGSDSKSETPKNILALLGFAASAVLFLLVGIALFVVVRNRARYVVERQTAWRITLDFAGTLGAATARLDDEGPVGRLGAIYSLVALSDESGRATPAVADTLLQFVRENASISPSKELGSGHAPDDVQIALKLLAHIQQTSSVPARLDLSGLDLRGIRLSGLNLKGVNLRNTLLSDADLTGVNLNGSDLSHAVMNRVVAIGTSFENALMDGANLSDALASSASFRGAYLVGAWLHRIVAVDSCFDRSTLAAADFTDADLSGACFKDAFLKAAHFKSAKMKNADLTGSIIDGALFSQAVLHGAQIEGIQGKAEGLTSRV